MAVPSSIKFRDLNQLLDMRRVVSSPSSETQTDVWGRIYPTSDSQADIVIHNGWEFDQFTTLDWQLWYFVYASKTWIVSMFDIIDGGRLVQIEVHSTSSLDFSGFPDLLTYDSDADAAAGGIVPLGGFYVAGGGHDRADKGGITSRLE